MMTSGSSPRGATKLNLIILWVVLIGAFVALYQFFATAPGAERSPPSISSFAILLGGVLVFLAFLVVLVRRARKTVASNNEGLTLLGEGRVSQAVEKFLAAQKKGLSSQAPLFHYNLAYARLLLWQLPAAELELLGARKKTMGTDLTRLVVPQHALVLALLGKTVDSQRVIAEASSAGMSSHSTVLVAKAVLAAREKNWSEVETLVRRQEVKQLGGTLRALAEALKAWAILEQTGQKRHVDRITLFGEAGPAQVQQHWPELAAFLESAPQE